MTALVFWFAVVAVGAVVGQDAQSAREEEDELTMTPVTYKCGKDSDCGVDMSTDDPKADALPHKDAPFPELQSLSPENVRDLMNNGRGGRKIASDRFFPNAGLGANQQIPYEAREHIPAMRRPCNLDKVLELLTSIQQDYAHENDIDAAFSTGKFNMTLAAAIQAHQVSKEAVAELEAARTANDTLFQLQAIAVAKATLIHDKLLIKADLIVQESRLKRPIVQALGRIKTEMEGALADKQHSLDNFGKPPLLSEEDRVRVLQLHSKLLGNLRHQQEIQTNLSHDLLVPVHLDLNQTEQQLDRLNEELIRLQDEIDTLLPSALTYSAEALASARAIEADTSAHLAAVAAAYEENLNEHATRKMERIASQDMLTSAAAIIADVQTPRDPKDTYVNVTESAAPPPETTPLPPA